MFKYRNILQLLFTLIFFSCPIYMANGEAASALDDVDGGVIAFTDVIHCPGADCECPDNIILASSNGTIVKEIETGCYDPSGLEWSADGEWLMLSMVDHLTLINTMTDEVRVLALDDLDLTASAPVFSPDASLIAYRAFSNTAWKNGNGIRSDHLNVMNVTGSDQHQIAPELVITGRPVWSPDGRKMIFAGIPASTFGTPEQCESDLYTVQPDGTGLQQLTETRIADGYPLFSPDGSQLIWSQRTFQTQHWNSMLMDMKTGISEFLTGDGDAGTPAAGWSPDGRYVILYRGGNRHFSGEKAELYLLNMETHLTQLLVTANTFGGVNRSPDGTQIVYSKRDEGTLYANICTLNIATTVENCPGLKGHWLSEPMWR